MKRTRSVAQNNHIHLKTYLLLSTDFHNQKYNIYAMEKKARAAVRERQLSY